MDVSEHAKLNTFKNSAADRFGSLSVIIYKDKHVLTQIRTFLYIFVRFLYLLIMLKLNFFSLIKIIY